MLGIICIVWLIHIDKKTISHIKNKIIDNKSLFISSAFFLFGATISIFTSVDIRTALGEWKAFYIEPFIFFLILISISSLQNVVNKNKKQKSFLDITFHLSSYQLTKTIISALLLSAFCTSLLAIYQHFTGWLVPYDFWANRDTYRVTAWYGFPNAVGLFFAPVFILGLYFFINKSYKIQDTNKSQKINSKLFFKYCILSVSCILLLTTFLFAIIYAKSTGALIGIATGICFLLFIWKRTRWFILVASIIALVGLFALPNDNAIRQELFMQDRSGQLRIEMWAETSAYLFEHPLRGTGLASYSERIAPYRIQKNIEIFHHPHNLLLTLWVNTGFIGLFGFLWLVVIVMRMFIVTTKQIDKTFFIATLITIFTTGLVDSPYIKNDLAFLFWTIVALFLIASYDKNMENKKT